MSAKLTVGILVSPGYFVCDIIGVHTVFGMQPDVELHLLWKDREPVLGLPTFPTVPTTAFADCPAELDVLAVGAISGEVLTDPEVIDFFGTAAARAKHVIAICGGAFLPGLAGLVNGKRATTNFHITDMLPLVGAIPVEGGQVVRDGNLWTAGPVTGSIEAALQVLAELRGVEVARRTELDLEFAPHPPFGTGSPALAGPELTAASMQAFEPMRDELRGLLSAPARTV
ncbi:MULTISPECIES: DJ-1/PfpI family protein [unclassified Crossiella]|uniref:DJ-1/PfpI family protein n=1 Tax=unclassified Crossiella TaxID=2620835 RepID=UPI001FFE7399|nr:MULTISPECIES: DJ-1/PfpI family protein [unclassified Crossiella]MCK2242882.1 DJ-1/PfpI family protein [Crossiella sp. S99.2]MCK2256759.1 DJ-1/PfpI family protein [Crossiella sp. S99.1]